MTDFIFQIDTPQLPVKKKGYNKEWVTRDSNEFYGKVYILSNKKKILSTEMFEIVYDYVQNNELVVDFTLPEHQYKCNIQINTDYNGKIPIIDIDKVGSSSVFLIKESWGDINVSSNCGDNPWDILVKLIKSISCKR